MTKIEKITLFFLLSGAMIAIIISMAAGLLGYSNASIGSSISALLISLCVIIYSMLIWKKK